MTDKASNKDKILEHMEFLGFETEDIGKNKGSLYFAERDRGASYLLNFNGDMLTVTMRWSGFNPKALGSKDFFNAINTVNQAVYSKWFYEESKDDGDPEDLTLVVESEYYGYDKKMFGAFIESIDRDILANLGEFSTFRKGE